jgi:hypothetical protein
VQAIGLRPKVCVSADGSGVVVHAGARLFADLADATGLTAAYSTALRPPRPRGTGHDPGRIATDLAVMLADGGKAIADLAVLRDQADVFGSVASTPTAWRLLADRTASGAARPPASAASPKIFRVVGGQGIAGQPTGRGSSARRWKAVASSCLQGQVADIRKRRRRPPRVRRAPTCSSR